MSDVEIGPYREVQDLLRKMFLMAEDGDDVTAIVDLVNGGIPDDALRDWLLVSRILANNALIVAQWWMDAPGVPRRIRRIVRDLLDRARALGLGEVLTEERFAEYHEEVLRRDVAKVEVIGQLLFILEVLSMNTDPNVEALLLVT